MENTVLTRSSVKLPSLHRIVELRGTARECGWTYGEHMAESITGFAMQDATMGASLADCCAGIQPDPERLVYARKCGEALHAWDAGVTDFAVGMAESTGRTFEEVVLLLLTEEIGHTKYCTAFGATAAGTSDGAPVIAQNWDGLSELYPWAHLTRYLCEGAPAALFYSYPGLWACTGVNEYGLGLLWTSTGIYPAIRPVVGVPTYALIAGLLAQKTCRNALHLLERTTFAGCFNFFMADETGEVWVVEGMPGNFEAVPCVDVISRANHYECRSLCEISGQTVPEAGLSANTAPRSQRVKELLEQNRGRVGPSVIEAILTDHGVKPGWDICQHPVPKRDRLTLDSMYILPQKREFWIARGSPCRRSYTRYTM
jgi:hypothetical protein